MRSSDSTRTLSLAQIHSALAYYYDHQIEMDKDIDLRLREADENLSQVGNMALRARVQCAKLERARRP
jgi:hypothetical protein